MHWWHKKTLRTNPYVNEQFSNLCQRIKRNETFITHNKFKANAQPFQKYTTCFLPKQKGAWSSIKPEHWLFWVRFYVLLLGDKTLWWIKKVFFDLVSVFVRMSWNLNITFKMLLELSKKVGGWHKWTMYCVSSSHYYWNMEHFNECDIVCYTCRNSLARNTIPML